jgi:hypothetical protein
LRDAASIPDSRFPIPEWGGEEGRPVTSPHLLLPLRLPEIGPHLGKLVTGTDRTPGGVRLDAVRERLVTRLIDAAGEVRRLSARGEREAALHALDRTSWLSAWEEAVTRATELLVERVSRRLEAEARAVRMPPRLRPKLDEREQRGMQARIGSAGADLVAALDRLEACAGEALGATPQERDAMEAWQAAITACARRLEAAWLALEDALEREAARWEAVADAVAKWRRSLWPVVLVGAVLAGAATWLGLVLGGYVPPPRWLERVWAAAGLP